MPLSPAKAATVAGVSRSAISKALAAGQLIGFKRNNGHWSITKKDLADWMGNTISRADSTPAPPEPHPKRSDLAELETLREELKVATAAGQETREELASTEARLEALEEVISNLKADRDAWQAQAKALASRSGGIFARIFGG
jgi:FtsZ-binding cell division protein ZapB